MKLLIGGSPCTYWSIAQTKNRETETSGMGWELFKNFLIARDKWGPDYFLYENNKSMSPAIRAQITKEFGFEPVMIDSALVSAQSRKRLYWLGRREPDGTYSRVNVELPEDRGIILRDILETGVAFREKAYTLLSTTGGTTAEDMVRRGQRNGAAEPINTTEVGKSYALKGQYAKNGAANLLCGGGHYPSSGAAEMICETTDGQLQLIAVGDAPIPLNTTQDEKAQCLRASCWKDGIRNMVGNDKDRRTCCAEPIKIGEVNGGGQGNRVYSIDGKICAITAQGGGQGSNTQLYAEPVRIPEYGTESKSRPLSASYANKGSGEGSLKTEAFPDNPNKQVFDYVAEPMRIGTIESAAKNPGQDSQQYRVYGPDGKSVTLCGAGGVLVQRPACTQCRSARANACPGSNKAGICGNHAGGMCGLVHAVQQDKEGQTNE